jgi:acyl-CoA dehydrogenase
VDLSLSARGEDLLQMMRTFVAEEVIPREAEHHLELTRMRAAGEPHGEPDVLVALKSRARASGLWNLFLTRALPERLGEGGGLSVLDYARIAEESGRSPLLAPEAINGAAPDTGRGLTTLRGHHRDGCHRS